MRRIYNDANTEIIKVIINNKIKPFLINDWNYSWSEEEIKESFEIIGRDITLEDVMIAIEKNTKDIAINVSGEFMQYGVRIEPNLNVLQWDNIFGDTKEFWKPNTPLHLQLEETIEFLNNIIK